MNRSSKMKARRRRTLFFAVVIIAVLIVGFLVTKYEDTTAQAPEGTVAPPKATDAAAPAETDKPGEAGKPSNGSGGERAVIAQPESIAVLVNKQNMLPDDYKPSDLVYPDVPFLFKDKIDKRKMRSEAAGALEEMFDGAKADGIRLAGVSAYRSHTTQKSLFDGYVKKDGLEKAMTYSAYPGTSEHETGLAIDVSGSDGKCAATDCFAGTPEAEWLAGHAAEYGFIIRYPQGQESITGYKYEPWHLRYVGKEIASDIASRGITLEEYFDAVPVNN
ncbi:D-alanyl-D-alanine carboxypeptidase family protein [Paenibacillus sp. NPDC058071]|uniref:M15 family metallopeptidase n=1 Tax=Paenibacillus sp. NPDC058071 TaxID=3346326 RepID=UPI0036D79C1D